MIEPEPIPQNAPASKRTSSVVNSWLKGAVLSAVLVSAIGVIGIGLNSPHGWPGQTGGDEVSPSEQAARLNAFLAMNRLPLSVVDGSQVTDAVNSMELAPEDKARAIAAYTEQHSFVPAEPDSKPDPATQRVAPVGAQAKQAAPLAVGSRLAWITLWDSDVEDGDAVRIESEGYARTVLLKNKPVTFAIPVPASGTILIKGVRDGDGGGITVGMASGAAKVLLPVMSVDQTIALRVGLPQ